MAHPAKMPVILVRKLILNYSKPGDTVLDPMAGIGTTLIESILLGRNAIGVEYEERFHQIILKNLQHVQEMNKDSMWPRELGSCIVHRGDSRNLSQILMKTNESKISTSADVIVSSPPFFGEGVTESGKGTPTYQQTGFSKTIPYSKDNIAFEKKYGEIDAIVSSPPYGDIGLKLADNTKEGVIKKRHAEGREATEADFKLAERNANFNEKLGNAYSKDKENVGEMPYGEIDAIVSSPPYANRIDNSHGESGDRISEEKALPNKYSEDEGNIGNKKYQEKDVDAIISSPPFYGQEPFQDKNFEINGKKVKDFGSGEPYSENKNDKQQIANLPEGNIDSIITSPPFGDVIAGSKETDNFGKFNNESYSVNKEDENQLGNLSGETYITAMLKIYRESFKVLKPGGYMVLVVKNPRKQGKEIDLEADTVKLCKAAGFDLYQKCVHLLNQASFWQQNAKIKAIEKGEPYLLPLVEFVLVFRKPNGKV